MSEKKKQIDTENIKPWWLVSKLITGIKGDEVTLLGEKNRHNHNSAVILVTLPDSKVHEANMGPIWGRQDPGGPHVGPMNFAIWAGPWLGYKVVWYDENSKSYLSLCTYLTCGNMKWSIRMVSKKYVVRIKHTWMVKPYPVTFQYLNNKITNNKLGNHDPLKP